jgi:glyoxylase-like metal-dependent hydrolase (beta-lactamase superfamily II)
VEAVCGHGWRHGPFRCHQSAHSVLGPAGGFLIALRRMAIQEVAEHIFQLPVFNPFGALPTNAYVLSGERLGLVDPGPLHPRTREDLTEGLARLDRTMHDVEVVVLTHGHADHYGMAHTFTRARVLVGRRDLRKTVDLPAHMSAYGAAVERLMPTWGVPPAVAKGIPEFFSRLVEAGGSVPWAEPIDEGYRLEGFGPTLQAVETPGHTEGLLCLFREKDGCLLSSDQLLETIIPNPGLYVFDDPPGNGLADYIASVRKLAPLRVRLVLPGHGRSFTGFSERIQAVLDEHEQRLREVRTALDRESTVYGLAKKMFPDRDWDNSYFAFVVLLEAQGYLGLLRRRGWADSRYDAEREVYWSI